MTTLTIRRVALLNRIRGLMTLARDGANNPTVRIVAKKQIDVFDSMIANWPDYPISWLVAIKSELFDAQGDSRCNGYNNDADALDGINYLIGEAIDDISSCNG